MSSWESRDEPVVVVLAVLNFIFGGVCGGVSEDEDQVKLNPSGRALA
jgi:hypothetical protein